MSLLSPLSDQYAVFIIDHAAAHDDVSQWYQHDLDNPPLHISVFAGTEYQHLAGVGPQLLYTQVESELFDLARTQIEQTEEGAVFYTDAPFSDVCCWVRQAVSVATEHGRALCRCFEVGFINSAEQVLGEQRFWQHLNPMSGFSVYEGHEWSRAHPPLALTELQSAADLLITQHESEQLTQLRERRYYEGLTRTYEAHIPAINPIDWVQSQCRLATAYGFDTQYLNEQWLRAALQYGETFYQHEAINGYLEQETLTPLRRWQSISSTLAAV